MTFVRHIVYLWPEQHHLRPSRARVQMTLQGAQKNYLPNKSHVIIIIINAQGQIIQIGENVFQQERLFNMKSCCRQQIPFTAHTLPFRAFQRGQFVIWPRVVIKNSYQQWRCLVEVGAWDVEGLPLWAKPAHRQSYAPMACKPMPSRHWPPHQWNQAPVTLIYQWKIKWGERYRVKHDPKAKQRKWLPGNTILSTLS